VPARALDLYYKHAGTADDSQWPRGELGLPKPWREHEPLDDEVTIHSKFRCIDCGKNTHGGEYYMVHDSVWAASGIAPHGGMLCLGCLETRIGRELRPDDFSGIFPSVEVWQRHVAERERPL